MKIINSLSLLLISSKALLTDAVPGKLLKFIIINLYILKNQVLINLLIYIINIVNIISSFQGIGYKRNPNN